MSFWSELKRRNVVRVGLFYLVSAWLAIQVADVLLPALHAPDWVLRVLLMLLALGFVPALVLAWIYEITPEGIRREKDIEPSASITHQTARKLDMAVIVLLVAVGGMFLADRFFLQGDNSNDSSNLPAANATTAGEGETTLAPVASEPATEEMEAQPSIAVLPFTNMSGDAENEYFSDGISEELLNTLVSFGNLRVPSRTSSFTFKNSDLKLSQIASELGVDHVLEGSVRKAGQQVRITAQLIRADDDVHLWSQSYTRDLDDIFAIQREIAEAIASELSVALGEGDLLASQTTSNAEAYNLYLQGRYFWHQRTLEAFQNAERVLQQAVNLDPGFADAWAALADVYVLQPEYQWAPIEQAIPRARAAVGRALALSPESARALTTRAYYTYLYDWQWERAEADFQDAIAIDPGYATAWQWYAEMLLAMRRFDEAEENIRQAIQLDPLAPVHPMVMGNIVSYRGDPEESLAWYDQSISLSPDWPNSHYNKSDALKLLHRYDEAETLIAGLAKRQPATFWDDYLLSIRAQAGKADREEAVAAVLAAERDDCNSYDKPNALMELGEQDQALAMLARCQDRDPYAVAINVMPNFNTVRDDPRFMQLLANLNLPAGGGP